MQLSPWMFLDDIMEALALFQRQPSIREITVGLARITYNVVADVRGRDNMAGVERDKVIGAFEALVDALAPAFGYDPPVANKRPDAWGDLG